MDKNIKYTATMSLENFDTDGGVTKTYIGKFSGTKYGKNNSTKSIETTEYANFFTNEYETAKEKFQEEVNNLKSEGYDISVQS